MRFAPAEVRWPPLLLGTGRRIFGLETPDGLQYLMVRSTIGRSKKLRPFSVLGKMDAVLMNVLPLEGSGPRPSESR